MSPMDPKWKHFAILSKAGPLQEPKVDLATFVNLLLVGRAQLPDVQGR